MPALLRQVHDGCGHYSHLVTLDALRGRFFWPSRTEDVNLFCKSCVVCQQAGVDTHPISTVNLGPGSNGRSIQTKANTATKDEARRTYAPTVRTTAHTATKSTRSAVQL